MYTGTGEVRMVCSVCCALVVGVDEMVNGVVFECSK